MKTALLVIDAQESFRHRDYYTDTHLAAYISAQNHLIEGAQAQNLPIVRIYHCEGPELSSNPWAQASGFLVPILGLASFDAAQTFYKSKHSALVGTGLEPWLQANGIERLLVSGIRTEQCCETTARHASDVGFNVDYVLDATLTFDMQLTDGSPFKVEDIKARTASVLKERFARIASVAQALEVGQALTSSKETE
jgi:nicotinamidase-related amidase